MCAQALPVRKRIEKFLSLRGSKFSSQLNTLKSPAKATRRRKSFLISGWNLFMDLQPQPFPRSGRRQAAVGSDNLENTSDYLNSNLFACFYFWGRLVVEANGPKLITKTRTHTKWEKGFTSTTVWVVHRIIAPTFEWRKLCKEKGKSVAIFPTQFPRENIRWPKGLHTHTQTHTACNAQCTVVWSAMV